MTLLRDYRPYQPDAVKVIRDLTVAPNEVERERMDANARNTLDSYTTDAYFGDRFAEAIAAIERVHANAAEEIKGRVVEFAAGNCKLGGFLSTLPGVEHVTCIDFSDPLLTEIAPRVVSHIGGDLGKMTFMVADMNRIPELDLGPIDWLVGYYAVHHLDNPRAFFGALQDNVPRIFAFREPCVPIIPLPSQYLRGFLSAQARKRREGEFERNFSLFKYRRVAQGYEFRVTPGYGYRNVPVGSSRIRHGTVSIKEAVRTVAWHLPSDVAYILKRR